ncbi:hypothetical protein CF319_g5236 [Tilletia indica]|nr:hypothetical protein CF319_g5236 [Tilletia indica]
MAGPSSPTEAPAVFTAERRPLWTVPEISPSCSSILATDMAPLDASGQSSSIQGNRPGPRDRVSRRASVAFLAADPSNDLPARLTTDPLLLKPAMQSCLKNSFRLSLPYSPSVGGQTFADPASQAGSALPYPSPSIIFPSEADTRALAFAQKMAEHAQGPIGVTSSQNAVHQHYDRNRERAAILELEDARRASDPDVATNFENELFRWAEQENALSIEDGSLFHSTSLRSVSGASSIDPSTLNSPSVLEEGYRADLDSPMIDRDQYRIGTRIHTQAGARNKLRARAMAGQGWANIRSTQRSAASSDTSTRVEERLPQKALKSEQTSTCGSPETETETEIIIKTPRFSLLTEMVPRIGSPTHDLETSPTQNKVLSFSNNPDIVLPMESPEEEDFSTELKACTEALSQARARARTSTLNAPKTPYSWNKDYETPASPACLAPPAQGSKQSKASLPPTAAGGEKQRPWSMPPPGLSKQKTPVFAPSAPIPIPGPTRLQSRRPNSMRLRNLPDASIWAPVEIEVNGKSLVGRNMKAVAVYDPRKDAAALSEKEPAQTKAAPTTSIEAPSLASEETMLKAGEVNPPPPTPPRGSHIRGPARVRAATLNAMALKVNMMPDAKAHEGTTLNAHSKEVNQDTAFTVFGPGIGLGLTETMGAQTRLHGANAPESEDDVTPAEEVAQPKHRSLPNKLPEKVIPRPEVDNWLKDSTKPQPQPTEGTKPKSMHAWAQNTFEATDHGSVPGVINAPPSAYIGGVPSPCPEINLVASEDSPSTRPADEETDLDRKYHRAAAEAKLNGTPLLDRNVQLDAISTEVEPAQDRSPRPALKKGFMMGRLPSNAVSLNSASTTASARPFFAAETTSGKPGRAINVPRSAVLAKDRARRPADAAEKDRSAQLDSVLSAFSTEQLLAHLASRRGTSESKGARKVSAASVADSTISASAAGDLEARSRSPLIPQGAASPSLVGSPCPPSRGTGVSRSAKRNSAQRALARNRQRLAGVGSPNAPMMARMDSISSVGSVDMVREDSVSSFGSFMEQSQSPLLLSSADVRAGALSLGNSEAQLPLIDLTSPGSGDLAGFVPLTAAARIIATQMEISLSQASSDLNTDDRVSLLTSTSSNQVLTTDLPTPMTGMSVAITPLGSILTSAFARARLQTRAQTPLDFTRAGRALQGDGQGGESEDEDYGETGEGRSMLMERADSHASPILTSI